MKKNTIVLFLAILLSGAAWSQQATEKVLVDKKDLSTAQIAKIEADAKIEQVKQQVETAGKYAAVVQEFGTGVADASREVTDGTIAFGKTDLGRTIMWLIGFHVLGEEILGYITGIPVLIFLVYALVVTWNRNCLPWTYVQEESVKTPPAPGPWWQFGFRRTERRFETDDDPVRWEFRLWILAFFAVCLLATIAMML